MFIRFLLDLYLILRKLKTVALYFVKSLKSEFLYLIVFQVHDFHD